MLTDIQRVKCHKECHKVIGIQAALWDTDIAGGIFVLYSDDYYVKTVT